MGFSSDIPGLQNQLPFSIDFPRDPDELVNELNDTYQGIVSSLNSKVGGLYVPQEKVTSAQYFDTTNIQRFKNVYRMVVDFGALPNTSSKNIPHNIPDITAQYRIVQAYGGSTDPINISWLPIPNQDIRLEFNIENVTVTTTSNLSAFTETSIVIEYTKG